MGKVGIFFGTSTGNTETVAEKIASAIGDAELKNVSDGISAVDFESAHRHGVWATCRTTGKAPSASCRTRI